LLSHRDGERIKALEAVVLQQLLMAVVKMEGWMMD
jgi:hypothetical protein